MPDSMQSLTKVVLSHIAHVIDPLTHRSNKIAEEIDIIGSLVFDLLLSTSIHARYESTIQTIESRLIANEDTENFLKFQKIIQDLQKIKKQYQKALVARENPYANEP